jgi:outer membrane murein-binding lipoprotein Lpp
MDSEPTFPKRHPVWTTVLTVAAVLIVVALLSGGSSNQSNQQAATVTVHDVAPADPSATDAQPATSQTPAASPHKSHKTVAHAAKAKPPVHSKCDANIRVKTATTTCPFAQNVFLAYWTSQNYDGFALSAYSPAAGREIDVDCAPGETVVCAAGDGAEVSFPQSAADAYSLAQAKHYVASHDVGDDVFP